MTLDIKDRLYTSSEVAEILGVSLRSVYRYLEEGKLDADIKTATGRHRFSKKNILDFLQPSDNQPKISDKRETYEEPSQNTSSKSFSSIDTIEDDFDFDNFFETDIVKKDTSPSLRNEINNTQVRNDSNEYFEAEDDLEKLFEELEKEFANQNNDVIKNEEKKVSKIVEDDFDFDFDFLDKNEDLNDYLNSSKSESLKESKKEFDASDFDFDFLDSLGNEKEDKFQPTKTNLNENTTLSKDEDDFDFFNLDSIFNDEVSDSGKSKTKVEEKKEDESEGWLERFRKASEKNEPKTKKDSIDDFDLSSFFTNKSNTSSISAKDDAFDDEFMEVNEFKSAKESRRKEYFYMSSLSGPKEIAQTIDKVSRKFDLDYAFTLNAGLSLHKDISPFTLIHVYTNERDLEIFEDYLKLTPSSEKDAHICIIPAKDREIFEDSYELNGLFVVSNVQLRSDFIDKGMDNYAREV